MKAYLLAAGMGSRLKPITDTVPKCLVKINGYSMLDWWAKLLEESGVSEVLVNTHYLHEQVHEYIIKFNQKHKTIQYIEFYEKALLGSGGTVKANKKFVKNEEDFLICYADNICDVNLKNMIRYHREKKTVMTMGLFRAGHPEACGIAELDPDGRVIEFIEKPERPKSNLANAGVYVANKRIFSYFPDYEFIDFGKDIIPNLIGEMYGWEIEDYLLDIGTLENYKRAEREWTYDYHKDTLTN